MFLWLTILWLAILQTVVVQPFDNLHDNVLDELTAYTSQDVQNTQLYEEETTGYWNMIGNLLLELASTVGAVTSTGSKQGETSSNQMEHSARMLQSDYHSGNMGYQSHMPIQPVQEYSYQQQQTDIDYGNNGYRQSQQHGYRSKQQNSGYRTEEMAKTGYQEKPKKVFVPVVIRKKKAKKRKTISLFKGFYIPGGSQVFGKFKKLVDCKKSCARSPTCFSADYNPWLKKCYHHNNLTACANMRSHPKLTHFKKIPCAILETPRGLLTLGTHIFGGLEQKGIKSLQDCVKKCATAGQGIAPNTAMVNQQTCFAIDYDFATHKCYFHTDEDLCPLLIITPVSLSAKPSSINLLICPFAT